MYTLLIEGTLKVLDYLPKESYALSLMRKDKLSTLEVEPFYYFFTHKKRKPKPKHT